MIRVLIAEDQGLIRGALTALLSMEPDIEVVAQASDGQEAIDLAKTQHPDVALLDIEMPRLTGLDAIAHIRRDVPNCRILILTTFARAGYLQRAVKAGASGYMLKDAEINELASAIRSVHAGRKVMAPELMSTVFEPENPLSERETELLREARNGLGTRDLAARMHLSEGTIRNYLSEIIAKLGVQSRSDAIRTAEEKGWL